MDFGSFFIGVMTVLLLEVAVVIVNWKRIKARLG